MLAACLMTFVACEKNPSGGTRGYKLEGIPMSETVTGWEFVDTIQEIFIEVTPWYGIPHSVTIWCVALGDDLYIGTHNIGTPPEERAWVKNVMANGTAKLGIAGKVYTVVVLPVTDEELTARVDAAYREKYDFRKTFGDRESKWRYFLVKQSPL